MSVFTVFAWWFYLQCFDLTLLVGRQEGRLACKSKWVLIRWWQWLDWSFADLESFSWLWYHLHRLLMQQNPEWLTFGLPWLDIKRSLCFVLIGLMFTPLVLSTLVLMPLVGVRKCIRSIETSLQQSPDIFLRRPRICGDKLTMEK